MGAVMKVTPTPIEGVHVVESPVFADERGEFARLYCEDSLAPVLEGRRIVQINRSLTTHTGTVRGLHLQHAPHAEMKFVRCLRGRVWDVVADLRPASATFRQWHARELTGGNGLMLVIPEGCAHGFQALEPGSELLYLHTAAYAPRAEGGVRFDDPTLALPWPLPPRGISARDLALPLLGGSPTQGLP